MNGLIILILAFMIFVAFVLLLVYKSGKEATIEAGQFEKATFEKMLSAVLDAYSIYESNRKQHGLTDEVRILHTDYLKLRKELIKYVEK